MVLYVVQTWHLRLNSNAIKLRHSYQVRFLPQRGLTLVEKVPPPSPEPRKAIPLRVGVAPTGLGGESGTIFCYRSDEPQRVATTLLNN
jgi:hypothetical protein